MMYDDQQLGETRPRQRHVHVVVIDDTFDMEVAKHGLLTYGQGLFSIMHQPREAPVDITVEPVKSKAEALHTLDELQHVDPKDIIVVSDYKLHVPGQAEEKGPDILTEIAGRPDRPGQLFLMSKSGFDGAEQAKLDAIGAKYFHTNELFYIAAARNKNEALQEVFSQASKTNTFRAWCNEHLGTTYELGKYRASNVVAGQRGRIPVTEVIDRIDKKEITHAEGMAMLDADSVRAAFRSHVEAAGEEPARIGYGIEGPSVQGVLAFSEEDIHDIRAKTPGVPVILVLDHDYSPKDHPAVLQSNAVVMLGRGTQHIQILAKNLGIPVLFANRDKYPELSVTDRALQRHEGALPPRVFAHPGDWLTLDGADRLLYTGKLAIKEAPAEARKAAEEMASIGHYHNQMTWHFRDIDDRLRDRTGVRVMANADNAEQIAEAKKNPAVAGVGLLRTEHMFFSDARRLLLMKALLAEGPAKQDALEELTRAHTEDLKPVFEHQTDKFPIRVRLFDFPPAEFFPDADDRAATGGIATALGVEEDKVRNLCYRIHEEKLRGAAFAEAFPDVALAQCRAIFAAAGEKRPDIMVPVVRSGDQMRNVSLLISKAANKHARRVGAMLETQELSSSHTLEEVTQQCEFLSFGTNDLTEELLELQRGDVQAVHDWSQKSRQPINPFNELSREVEDALMHMTMTARRYQPDIDISLCGDQASSRRTVELCQFMHLNSLSVPPNPEMVTQALVETGRSALLEATAQREMRAREMAERKAATQKIEAAQKERAEGKLPPSIEVLSPNVLQASPVAFIVMENEKVWMDEYRELTGYPLVLCQNVSDTLSAIDAMKAQGKQIHIFADAQLPMASYEDEKQGTMHPLCAEVQQEKGQYTPLGVALLKYIAQKKIPGVGLDDVTMLSLLGYEELPKEKDGKVGVMVAEKDNYMGEWLKTRMDDRIQAARFAAKKQDKTVVIVDDEPEWAAECKQIIERRFHCPVETFTSPAAARERVKKGDVAAVLTDQLMPGMTGMQLAETLRAEAPGVPVVVVTNNDDFVWANPDGINQIPLMRKVEVERMQHRGNILKRFLAEALHGPGAELGA